MKQASQLQLRCVGCSYKSTGNHSPATIPSRYARKLNSGIDAPAKAMSPLVISFGSAYSGTTLNCELQATGAGQVNTVSGQSEFNATQLELRTLLRCQGGPWQREEGAVALLAPSRSSGLGFG